MTTKSGEAVERTTSGNVILSRLLAVDRQMLLPHFSHVVLTRGTRLLIAAEPAAAFYFPEDGLFAIEEASANGRRVEVAVVGREGMLGWPALLGGAHHAHDAVFHGQNGRALRIPIEPVIAACRRSETLWAALLGFVRVVMEQMAGTIASSVENSLDQRIARWLLMRHDRLGGDHILTHHGEIADALGTRRASITDRLHVLEGDQLIRCRRGRIVVRDRGGLEAFAGDAYAAAGARRFGTVPDRGDGSSVRLHSDLV